MYTSIAAALDIAPQPILETPSSLISSPDSMAQPPANTKQVVGSVHCKIDSLARNALTPELAGDSTAICLASAGSAASEAGEQCTALLWAPLKGQEA